MATQSMRKGESLIKNVSANYALERVVDRRYIIRVDGTVTITLPSNLPIGYEAIIVNAGTGTVTLSAQGTLNAAASTLTTQWAATTVVKVSATEWDAYGQLG